MERGRTVHVSDRVSGEVRQYNTDLLAAQEDLRRVADRDPLTTLMNRGALPGLSHCPAASTSLGFAARTTFDARRYTIPPVTSALPATSSQRTVSPL